MSTEPRCLADPILLRDALWVLFGAGIALALVGGQPAFAQDGPAASMFYVATNGNDRWSGRLAAPNEARTDGPFVSLTQAQRAVRQLKREGLKRPVRVVVRGGAYELKEPLVFTREDGGTEACPITYEAQPGERVTVRGGRAVSGWKPLRDGIYQADLKAQGLAGASFHQLFYRGARQVLARYPNRDPEHPRTGGFLYVEDHGNRPRDELLYAEGAIPFDRWGDISQAEVVSTYCGGWSFAITPILDVDTTRRLITVRRVRRTFERNNRFFIQNVFGALDARGEWFLDRKKSMLYFIPPDGKVADGEVIVPLIDHLIVVQGSIPYPHGYLNVKFHGSREEYPTPEDQPADEPVEYLTFKGFHLEAARRDAIRLIGARRCAVIGCVVTNVGGVGLNLGGVTPGYVEVGNPRVVPAEGVFGGVGGAGQDVLFNDPCQECRVIGNDVWSIGSDGIFLYGTGNVAENNQVYDIGLFDKDCAGINAFGEQNVVRRNDLHDVPRNAVFLKGIENVIELNNIHHTMLETCDGGAIRMCQRNLTLRGNIIRWNKILDTVGYGHPRGGDYQSPYFSWGVYLDDFTCGTTVQGNIIARTGRGGVMVHGGSDNIVLNNIIVDAGSYEFENVPIRERPVTGNRVRRNILVCDGDKTVVYRCTKWLDGSVSFDHNLVWTRGGPFRADTGRGGKGFDAWETWQAAGFDQGSALGDPLFENPDADDYRLRQQSPALKLGFEQIPLDQIGCYQSPERASWPLRVVPTLVREQPVLYVAPARPLQEDFELDPVGRPPRHGDVLASRKAPIVVTDEVAAEGKHSLKIVDAPGLRNAWEPRIFYALRYREGTVRFSCEFRLDSRKPPRVMVDPRQYSDTGGKEYFSGPIIFLTPEGELTAAGKPLAKVPFDQWFKIELTMVLGENAPTSSEMLLTVRGRQPQQLEVPHGSPKFQRLERVVIASMAEEQSLFYIDNVTCLPEGK